MVNKNQQYAAAGFVIGLVCGLALVALGIGGYLIVQRNSALRPTRVGQRVDVPNPAPAAVTPVTLAVAELLVYEPFDAASAGAEPVSRELQPGKFGEAARLHIDNPLVYAVPGANFLRAATIMAWVRIDNQRDRSFIWAYSRNYPNAFYYPDHNYKLGMHFMRFDRQGVSSTLAQVMQPGRYYHLGQTWGPDGFFTYLDGVQMLRDTNNRVGNLANPQGTENDALYLGSHPGALGDVRPGWQWNSDGILVDDFAVFNRQLRADEVAGVAQSGLPLGDILQ